jgi:hypothetical protein
MLRAFTDFDGLHLVDFSARAQVVLSESAASTNSATRATRAFAVALPGHGGRDYRGTFAERVWGKRNETGSSVHFRVKSSAEGVGRNRGDACAVAGAV